MYGFKNVQIRVDWASKLQHFPRLFYMQLCNGPSCYLQDSMVRETVISSYLPRTQALLGIFWVVAVQGVMESLPMCLCIFEVFP